MKKLILVDQSIKDAGGHHLEYAVRVLQAAKAAGYHTVLAVNKECAAIELADVDVVDKAFTFTFWENLQGQSKSAMARGGYRKRALDTLHGAAYRLLQSDFGMSYQAALQGSRHFAQTRRAKGADKLLRSPLLLAGSTLGLLHLLWRGVNFRGKRLLGRLVRLAAKVLAALTILLLSPAVAVWLLLTTRPWHRRGIGNEDVFAHDLSRMAMRVRAAPGDIVFVPTLGVTELRGAQLCARSGALSKVGWHFLFRRNLFRGREPSYTEQISAVAEEVETFSRFCIESSEIEAYFYTDTDALTKQYEALGSVPFTTLPIPLDEALRRSELSHKPVVLSYIGDARGEKGYPLLPRLVADLRTAGYADQVQFYIQSNFNVPGGEPASRVARAELSAEQEPYVQLVEGPFNSTEYAELVSQAGILLVPYDSDNYYARSSGIFAEALGAGVPVVASSKSWMAQELLSAHLDHYDRVLTQTPILQAQPVVHGIYAERALIRPKTHQSEVYLHIEVLQREPRPGVYLDVSWQAHPSFIGKMDKSQVYPRRYSLDLRKPRAMALLRLPRSSEVVIKLKLDLGGGAPKSAAMDPETSTVMIRELDATHPIPLWSVGALYSSTEDFSTATLELLQHFERYTEDAERAGEQWRKFHSARNLVNILTSTS